MTLTMTRYLMHLETRQVSLKLGTLPKPLTSLRICKRPRPMLEDLYIKDRLPKGNYIRYLNNSMSFHQGRLPYQ